MYPGITSCTSCWTIGDWKPQCLATSVLSFKKMQPEQWQSPCWCITLCCRCANKYPANAQTTCWRAKQRLRGNVWCSLGVLSSCSGALGAGVLPDYIVLHWTECICGTSYYFMIWYPGKLEYIAPHGYTPSPQLCKSWVYFSWVYDRTSSLTVAANAPYEHCRAHYQKKDLGGSSELHSFALC